MRRAPVLAVLSAVLLSGCGPTSPLAINLRSVSITVPRLVTPAIQLIPPATAPQPVSLPQLPPVISFLPPAETPQAPAAPAAAAPAPAPIVVCPKAGPLAVPAKPASLTVAKPPAAGSYPQAATGSYAGSSATPASGPLNGPVTVTVKSLPSTATTVGQVVDSYSVERTDSARKASSVEVYQLVHPSTAPGATAGGIYLVGMAWKDPIRGDLTFQPTGTSLQILPLPVQVSNSAAQYAGSATDPNTLTTLSIVRNVMGRKRVDVCGQLVDTFTVEITGTLTTPDTQRQIAWTQHLATSYGGADVEDTQSLSSPTAGFSYIRTVRNIVLPKGVA